MKIRPIVVFITDWIEYAIANDLNRDSPRSDKDLIAMLKDDELTLYNILYGYDDYDVFFCNWPMGSWKLFKPRSVPHAKDSREYAIEFKSFTDSRDVETAFSGYVTDMKPSEHILSYQEKKYMRSRIIPLATMSSL